MRDHRNQSMGLLEWGLLIGLSILWGGAFFFSKVALRELPPFTVVWARVTLAAIVLCLVLRLRGDRLPRSPRTWAAFLGMGLLNNLIPFSLMFWAQTQIQSSLASILCATTPLWTVLLAHVFTTDEKLTLGRLGGVLLGIAGVVVTIGLRSFQTLGLGVWGQLAAVGAAMSYAAAGIYGKRFSGRSPLVLATGQVTGTAVMMIPVVLISDRPWTLPLPGLVTFGALVGLSVLSTALAYIIYFRLLASAGATNVLLVTFLMPVSTLILGMTFLGEVLDPRHFLGMGLIGLSLVAIDGRVLRYLQKASERKPSVTAGTR